MFLRKIDSWTRYRTALVAGLILLLASCGPSHRPVFQETDEPDYQKGKRLLRQGEDELALLSFLRVIENRNDAPESHLETGLIYLEDMNQPILAIYHFMKFLELRPDAKQAPEVEKLINTAKKEFARTLPGRPFQSEVENLDMLSLVERLRGENESLKGRLSEAQRENQELRERLRESRPGPSQSTANSPNPSTVPASQSREYTVQPGDTLSSISRKVYGSSSRWEEIFRANRNILNSPNDLRVGQNLRIPRP